MIDLLDDSNWVEAFGYAGQPETCAVTIQGGPSVFWAGTEDPAPHFTVEDVVEVIASDEGEYDEADWLMVGRLKSGLFFFLSAGCDYTGWD